jgi:hypothetical protein
VVTRQILAPDWVAASGPISLLHLNQLFPYEVRGGRLQLEEAPGEVVAHLLRATKAFGFSKDPFSQTRWPFDG